MQCNINIELLEFGYSFRLSLCLLIKFVVIDVDVVTFVVDQTHTAFHSILTRDAGPKPHIRRENPARALHRRANSI